MLELLVLSRRLERHLAGFFCRTVEVVSRWSSVGRSLELGSKSSSLESRL